MKTSVLIGLWIGLSCVASAAKKKTTKQSVPNGAFTLVQLVDDQKTLEPAGVKGDINFNQKKNLVHIFLGCNRITGKFGASDNRHCHPQITMSTRIACTNPIEDRFKSAFLSSTQFTLRNDTLTLLDETSALIILVRKSKSTKQTLQMDPQGNYRLYSIFDGKKMTTENYSKTHFSIDGKQLRANVGCNGIFGEWNTAGQLIQPLHLGMT